MTSLLRSTELLELATRVIWFEQPETALDDSSRFLAYAMTYALPEDMATIRRYVDDDAFRKALDNLPPGIVDARSWAYWNLRLGRFPPPEQPGRNLPG